jgi:hypothetical protein
LVGILSYLKYFPWIIFYFLTGLARN